MFDLYVKKSECPARPSSVAVLLRRVEKHGVLHVLPGLGVSFGETKDAVREARIWG